MTTQTFISFVGLCAFLPVELERRLIQLSGLLNEDQLDEVALELEKTAERDQRALVDHEWRLRNIERTARGDAPFDATRLPAPLPA